MTHEEQQAYAEAQNRIEACRKALLEGEKVRLDLSELGLTELPGEIFNVTALTVLFLQNNRLTTLPKEIGKLTALTQLYLADNELTSLPGEIGRLTALTDLFLYNNRLTSLPAEIGRLTALKQLDLQNNKLTELPVEIGELTALTRLNLFKNRLKGVASAVCRLAALTDLDIGENYLTTLPREIGQLAGLTRLLLPNNHLTTLPGTISGISRLEELWLQSNQLRFLPTGLKKLSRLRLLYLQDNPDLGLSPSVLGPFPQIRANEGTPSPQSILDLYFTRNTEATRPLNEVKLLLVGRGGTGKTSTVNALRGRPFREGQESTPGVSLSDWKMGDSTGEPITAHVWDFAGQVIDHALHQFFFSSRSIYVLVLTGRESSEREDAEYWLRLIKAFGTDEKGNGPPVLVALNKWDTLGCPARRLNRGALTESYPFIRGFVEMDCKTQRGVAELKAALSREVCDLPWMREPFPESWDAVRRALASDESGKRRAYISYEEYRRLCSKHKVTDSQKQDSLAEILHNLGSALNYRMDPRLREATVLQPEWLTNHVYALMHHAESRDGLLKVQELPGVLSDVTDPRMRTYLLQLMERFEIAYPQKPFDTEFWLVPQALPDEQPEGAAAFAKATEATRLRYKYEALPEGLVARAIVRLHEFIEEAPDGKKEQWASGAILTREGARALLRKEAQDRVVMVTVTGPPKARQQLAGLCQAEMRDIHREVPGLDPTEETQVQGAWVETATLEGDERNRQQTGVPTKGGTVMVDPAGPNNAYSEKPARQEEVWKPSVFISYSKSNVAQRKRLESELKILKNEGLLASHWQDRMIGAGEEWDGAIQSKLAEADVVIILASSAALATDYITDHEIPKALELHIAGTAVVVPVILEKCRWEKTALGALNGLPEKAKPLNTWTRSSDAWSSVANGLAAVFERLMKGRSTSR